MANWTRVRVPGHSQFPSKRSAFHPNWPCPQSPLHAHTQKLFALRSFSVVLLIAMFLLIFRYRCWLAMLSFKPTLALVIHQSPNYVNTATYGLCQRRPFCVRNLGKMFQTSLPARLDHNRLPFSEKNVFKCIGNSFEKLIFNLFLHPPRWTLFEHIQCESDTLWPQGNSSPFLLIDYFACVLISFHTGRVSHCLKCPDFVCAPLPSDSSINDPMFVIKRDFPSKTF